MQIAIDYAEKRYSDFAVVIQPFVSNSRADKFPIEFLSTVSSQNAHTRYIPLYTNTHCSQLDCFHPSLIAHQNMAKALWNNMITPAAQKKTTFDFVEPFACPTNSTLLYTY